MPILIGSNPPKVLDRSIRCIAANPPLVGNGQGMRINRNCYFFFTIKDKGRQREANLPFSSDGNGSTGSIHSITFRHRFSVSKMAKKLG